MDLRWASGRGAFYERRSSTGRSCGAYRRENAGVSSGTWVRIPRTENPRFPEEGSSALGKSGPKARPRGVVDGQQVEIPVLTVWMKEWRRRLGDPAAGRAGASEVADIQANPDIGKAKAWSGWKAKASTEVIEASFQEKLLVKIIQ